MFESFGAQARQVIVHAQQEARRLQHNWIGTEHLLLGVMDVGGSVGELLTAGRVGVDDVRQDVEAIIGRTSEPLLGLLRERDGVAAQVLARRGLNLDRLRAQVLGA